MVDHIDGRRKFQSSEKGRSSSDEEFWEKKQEDHGS
jgi:hypothetical protein